MTPKCYSYVRFSTLEQQKGSSLDRQLKMSEEYAREHGLELDSMRDLGLSAFKGEHRTKGALGRFLTLVKDGKIPKDSILIVESLDRLSREKVFDALEQFRNIIQAGIRIITLTDQMEYTKESINANIGQLIISLTIMSRANEESLIKSKRLKSAWDQKRGKIDKKKLTARAPAWLKLSEDKTYFEIIPERAKIILRIYQAKLAGKGIGFICRELNKQTVWLPNKQKRNGTPDGWYESYIQKILRFPAVIGDYQLHTLTMDEQGRRIRKPLGDPIKDYFPAVVPAELYYSVQKKLEESRAKPGNSGGRNGKISNLFGHLAKCGYCGAPMAFIDKGPKPKGGSYLICDVARRGLSTCKKRLINYGEFEMMVLTYCQKLNPGDLLPGNEERVSVLNLLQGQLFTVQGHLKELEAKVANLSDSIATTQNPAVRRVLENQLADILTKEETYKSDEKQITNNIVRQTRSFDETETQLKSLRELFTYLQDHTGDRLTDVRQRLRMRLRELIDRIEVFPVGKFRMTEEHVQGILSAILDINPDSDAEELKGLEEHARSKIENRDLRKFDIYFKGGNIRTIEPAAKEKLAIDLNRETGKMQVAEYNSEGKTFIREYP
ncbi:MAG: recombinase family protein [Deltaproteobacteria bacterium]